MDDFDGESALGNNVSNTDEHNKESLDDDGFGAELKGVESAFEKVTNEQNTIGYALAGGGTGKETNEEKEKEELGVEAGVNTEVKGQEDMEDQVTRADDLKVEEGDNGNTEDALVNEIDEDDALIDEIDEDDALIDENEEDDELIDEDEEDDDFEFEEFEDSEEDSEEDTEEELMSEEYSEYELMCEEVLEEQKVSGEDTKVEEMNEDSVHETQEGGEGHAEEELLVENVMNKEAENDSNKCKGKFKAETNKSMKSKKTKMGLGASSKAANKDAVTEGTKSQEDKNEVDMKHLVNNERKRPESKENIEQPRKRRKKVLVRRKDKQDAKDSDTKEGNNEGNKGEETVKETEQKQIVKNEEKNASTPQGKNKKLRRAEGKKILGGPNEVAVRGVDKPDSEKKVKTMGMIFMCNSKTKTDCYRYRVLGLPDSKRDVVLKIYKGMRLFLYDFDLKLMYGIYKAAEPGGYNIEPKAFKSAFPSQVRFKVLEDCLPLPEEHFKAAIKDNYYSKTKFDCQLNAAQVNSLCKLFQDASRQHKSKPSQGATSRQHGSKSSKGATSRQHESRPSQGATSRQPKSKPSHGAASRYQRPKPSQGAAREDIHASHGHRKFRQHGRGRERAHAASGYSERHSERFMPEREAIAPWIAQPSLHALPPLPSSSVLPPVYAYDPYGRTLERDVYRHDLHERLYPEVDMRRHHEEVGYYDPYRVQRQYPAPRESLYSHGHQSVYSSADPLREYYSRDLQPDSHGYRPLYRY